MPTNIISHDVLEPLEQVFSASRDVIFSGQICASKLQRIFTLGDGCCLPTQVLELVFRVRKKGSFGKGVFWKRGLFKKVHFLEILENLEILEILENLENPQTVENKGEADHFLEILENLEILEILEIPLVKGPLS